MRPFWWVTKILGALAASAVLVAVLYFAILVLRKSVPFVLRSDLEQLAASGPLNDQALATQICGGPVDFLGAPYTLSPATGLPQAKLLSWWPFYAMEGSASASIVGVGVSRLTAKAVTPPCQAIVTFRYRCAWVDNGRTVVLQTQFLDPPKIVPHQ